MNQIRKNAMIKAEDKCSKCVLTIPAYFDKVQIEDTLKACKEAGLDCKAMVPEPTAAAVYYAF